MKQWIAVALTVLMGTTISPSIINAEMQLYDDFNGRIEMFCNRGSIPSSLTRWRWKLQRLENFIAERRIIAHRLPAARFFLEPFDAMPLKTTAPFNDSIGANVQILCDLLDPLVIQEFENDLGPLNQARFRRLTSDPFLDIFPC